MRRCAHQQCLVQYLRALVQCVQRCAVVDYHVSACNPRFPIQLRGHDLLNQLPIILIPGHRALDLQCLGHVDHHTDIHHRRLTALQ